ncbi:MAG: choice-of-anchor J domain-containing protein, partial [Bacteroidota bacterium]
MKYLSLFAILFVAFSQLTAQGPSRSGRPAVPEAKGANRDFPCAGTLFLDEDFESMGLPNGWTAIDGDDLTPNEDIQFLIPMKGWQSIIDFKDSTNRAFASPSWYEDSAGTSNDYLISPRLTKLPDNLCLSWSAYSQDQTFEEDYEVRISTTTPDEAGFLANPALVSIEGEQSTRDFRSTSLNDFAGMDIYIAFRHTSTDKFILVLDDIRLAEVEQFDLGLEVDKFTANPDDSISISGTILNLGLDTVRVDSAQLLISYQIDNEPVQVYEYPQADTLLPNASIRFTHDSTWVPTEDKVYRFRAWISGFGTDDRVENDSVGRWVGIGTFTSIDPQTLGWQLSIAPNPVQNLLQIGWEADKHTEGLIEILDIRGKVVVAGKNIRSNVGTTQIDLGAL